MGEDLGADIRLRAVAELAQAMAGAQRLRAAQPRHSTQRAVLHAAAVRACAALDGVFAALSSWDRARGRLDVLVNVGRLAPDESEFPEGESWPADEPPWPAAPPPWPADSLPEPTGFPEPTGPPTRTARIETADGTGPRAARLRERGRGCCLVAPIVLRGRAWGELYVARGPRDPVFDVADARFAAILTEVVAAGIAQSDELEAVRRLAFTDQLTGLANRRAVEAGLDDGLARHRADGTVVSLVVCDVNGLKRVNDELGHAAGDRLLERFGMVLSLAGARLPDALAARLGGDEFCLLTVGPSADRVARAAEDVCRRALALQGGAGVSCGVASTGDPIGPVRTAARLFRLADAAQYRAKAARATHPVIAGREGAEGASDPVVRLADTAHPTGGDRRTIRGHHPEPKPDELQDPARFEDADGDGSPGRPDRAGPGGTRVPTPGP